MRSLCALFVCVKTKSLNSQRWGDIESSEKQWLYNSESIRHFFLSFFLLLSLSFAIFRSTAVWLLSGVRVTNNSHSFTSRRCRLFIASLNVTCEMTLTTQQWRLVVPYIQNTYFCSRQKCRNRWDRVSVSVSVFVFIDRMCLCVSTRKLWI